MLRTCSSIESGVDIPRGPPTSPRGNQIQERQSLSSGTSWCGFQDLDPTGQPKKKRLTLVVETVDPVNRGALVVSSEQKEILWVFDFVSEEETDGLEGLFASVDVVAQEEVVGVWGEAAVLKESEEVVVLAVDVAADLDGGLELEEDGLGDEDLPRPETEEADFVLCEGDLLARPRPADCFGEERQLTVCSFWDSLWLFCHRGERRPAKPSPDLDRANPHSSVEPLDLWRDGVQTPLLTGDL